MPVFGQQIGCGGNLADGLFFDDVAAHRKRQALYRVIHLPDRFGLSLTGFVTQGTPCGNRDHACRCAHFQAIDRTAAGQFRIPAGPCQQKTTFWRYCGCYTVSGIVGIYRSHRYRVIKNAPVFDGYQDRGGLFMRFEGQLQAAVFENEGAWLPIYRHADLRCLTGHMEF